MKIKPNSRLLFIGDSITDCGRAQPYGDGGPSLGNGYVSLVEAHLGAVHPASRIRVMNVGTSGNTVRDLKNRWERDVIDLQPDYLSIMIGTNDVWRQFDSPQRPERHVLIEEYRTTLNELVSSTLPKVSGIFLLTPFLIEANCTDAFRAKMDEYGAEVKKIGAAHQLPVVDTQAAFNDYLTHNYSQTLAGDRVHPNLIGSNIIARAFLKAAEAL